MRVLLELPHAFWLGMARISPAVLRRYLLAGQVPPAGCLRQLRSARQAEHYGARSLHTTVDSPLAEHIIPQSISAQVPELSHRKELKRNAKLAKKNKPDPTSKTQTVDGWELTVGIEIHAQLNTKRKLFSAASSTIDDVPNTHVALFDVAMPGSQPTFQKATLIPAIRAALALNCEIQKTSRFDRKHYFHWDQPAGYQITQYYEPFAKNGHITLYKHDGIAVEDGEQITVGIKQIQMEQDTAKTTSEPGDIHLLDFNRVGLPLIEIITLPQIHYPATAAAFVRKVQMLLSSVDACVLGMESGGLRADVNVSVRQTDDLGDHEYSGVKGLGQRTEIKNLSGSNSIERAIIAERDRQIELLSSGRPVVGETRGWTIGQTQTVPLRQKEGEVDYRYMPDADLAPVIIGQDVVDYLRSTLGVLPEEEVQVLVNEYGITAKDAMTLLVRKDGARIEYFHKVVDSLLYLTGGEQKEMGKLAANWVLMEMGALETMAADEESPLWLSPEGDCLIGHTDLAELLYLLTSKKITVDTAKKVLAELFANARSGERENEVESGIASQVENGNAPKIYTSIWNLAKTLVPNVSSELQPRSQVEQIIEEKGLWFKPMSEAEYEELAESILDMKVVEEILSGKEGKINFLLGKMMRRDSDGRVDALEAMKVLRRIIEGHRK